MTKGMGRTDQKHFTKTCQRHKIGKKIFELRETQTVKNLLSAWELLEIRSDFELRVLGK